MRADTRYGEIAFDVLGDGPPVVLVHGTPSRALLWSRIAPVLAETHRVFVYDLLGFGDSERDVAQGVSVALQAQVLGELLDMWELVAPAVVGHDIGGATVLRAHLVEHVPFERIALIDAVVLRPWITPRTRQMQHELDRYDPLPSGELATTIREHLGTATHAPLPPERFAALFDQWNGREGQALYLRNLAQFDEKHTDEFEHLLPTIAVPVLILWGAEDRWLPLETSERIAERVPGAERVVVAHAGHFSMEDQPERIAAELRRFLAG